MTHADETREPRYEVVWPLGASTNEAVPLSARLAALDGATVGFVWDYVFRGDQIFAQLQQALAERYPGMRFVSYEAFGNIHGAQEREVVAALPARLNEQGVDAVVVGIAN